MGEQSSLEEYWRALGISGEIVASRRLPILHEPAELVEAEVASKGRVHQLAPEASEAWREMKNAAAAEGVEIYMISGFRSVARQAELIQGKLEEGQVIADILSVLAPPGCSEHHTGRAVDIGTPGYEGLDKAFENSPAFQWLTNNAQRFGFTLSFPIGNRWGYQYEPWHWCFTAKAA